MSTATCRRAARLDTKPGWLARCPIPDPSHPFPPALELRRSEAAQSSLWVKLCLVQTGGQRLEGALRMSLTLLSRCTHPGSTWLSLPCHLDFGLNAMSSWRLSFDAHPEAGPLPYCPFLVLLVCVEGHRPWTARLNPRLTAL